MSDPRILFDAMSTAHMNSALNNDNVSSSVIQQMARVHKTFGEAIAAAILTLGNVHGPVPQARQILYYTADKLLIQSITEGYIVPGFGNSFYKDSIDPAWEEFEALLIKEFPERAERISEVSAMISEAKGRKIYPNPAAFTATVADLINLPFETEVGLVVNSRMQAWAEQWSAARYPA